MNEKEKQLKAILTLLNESVSKDDFEKTFRILIDFVKKLKEQNTSDFAEMQRLIGLHVAEMKADIADTVRARVLEIRDGKDGASGKDGIDGAPGKDGRDADEQAIINAVLAKIPEIKALEPDTPEIVRNKLEALIGEDRLDKSAVKGIDEELEKLREIRNTGKGGTGPNYLQKFSGTISPKFAGDAFVVNAHEATGLVPQVMNGGYCAIGDLPDVATVPEGTFFFILP
jgi:hypothetical protein